VTGTGTFWFRASAKTEIFLVGVEFVKMGGRPGHEGLFRIAGQPLAGFPATLQIRLSGPIETAAFRLVTLGGDAMTPVTLAMTSRSGDEHEYVGTFDLPRQPFRLSVTGGDSNSWPYQRIFHTLFHAETVEVASADAQVDEVSLGTTSSVKFAVLNIGQRRTFRIVGIDNKRFVSRIDPQELTLASGASGLVTVDLTVPPDTALSTGLDVTITATSTSDTTTNGTVKHLVVVPPHQ